MDMPSLEQVRELADRLGITPDGFGEGERHWDWATDYPVIIRVLAALEAVEATATVQHGHPSAYWVKHQVEHDLGEYVSQGAVILAWLTLKRSLQRHPGDSPADQRQPAPVSSRRLLSLIQPATRRAFSWAAVTPVPPNSTQKRARPVMAPCTHNAAQGRN